MIRAVLDANVLASALINSKGISERIVRALVSDRAFASVTSPALTEEVERCLFYPKVRKYVKGSDDEIRAWVISFTLVSDIVEPDIEVDAVKADPDDNKYLEAALEGGADYVVSGDSHLLDMKEYEGIRIVTPRAFLKALNV